ncbi:MAG TPA: NAD(P)-binding domain-containing protein, partial [Tianweitania sediminis]|nr:NAD(P)-binding domain-containing protein [Tianweitania sediminis]
MSVAERIQPPSRVAVIGIGKMGAPIASRLIDGGFEVAVFDAHEPMLDPFRARPCFVASSAADAAKDADALITMLPTGCDVRTALFGPTGALETLKTGAMVIEMSTIDVRESSRLAFELEAAGLRMVDAPVART